MATEARRGFARIVANYARLVCFLTLGIIRVPLLIAWVGLDAFGLIAMVGASVGVAGMFQQFTNQGMIRDLGAALHSGSDETFLRAYNSAYLVAGVVAAVSAVVFCGLGATIHLLSFPEEWVGAARWFIVGQGIYSCLLVLLAPAFSMYQVQERFGWYAIWMVAMRSTALLAVLVLWFGFDVREPAAAIRLYGILWSALLCVILVMAVVKVVLDDRRLLPAPRLAHWATAREISHTFTWNSAARIGMGLHDRLAAVVMNLAFGVFGNAVFEVALRLVAYVRMATTGVTFGLDAASARLSTGSRPDALRALTRHTTRLQSVVAIPFGLAVFVLASPLLTLWIGSQVERPDVIPLAVTIVQILTIPLTTRAIADGWSTILYGAGYVRRYAPLMFAGGIVSPLVGAALLFILPESIRINAPALGYALVVTVVHFLLLPAIGARCLGVPFGDLFGPMVRPALVTLLCAPLLVVPAMVIDEWSLPLLVALAALFGVPYALVTWMLVLTGDERRRFVGAARRRLAVR